MVQEILKNIDQKKDQEINRLKEEKEKRLLALKERAKAEMSQRKEAALLVSKKETSDQVAEFSQKENTKSDFLFQEEKNRIVDSVWDQVEAKIKKMPDDSFEKIISFLVKSIPKDLEGEIKASERTAKILKKSLKKFKVKDDLREEGFLVKTKNLDLDFRISEVLKQIKENLNPKIIEILF